ncbi:protein kinase domain-containing protein [Endozoicomonas sp.]|uniref:protein kinase domain-containing protein n=1 Tax=Endozoicomonas sp. TaxID=1892382 RepID=UPI00383A6DA9
MLSDPMLINNGVFEIRGLIEHSVQRCDVDNGETSHPHQKESNGGHSDDQPESLIRTDSTCFFRSHSDSQSSSASNSQGSANHQSVTSQGRARALGMVSQSSSGGSSGAGGSPGGRKPNNNPFGRKEPQSSVDVGCDKDSGKTRSREKKKLKDTELERLERLERQSIEKKKPKELNAHKKAERTQLLLKAEETSEAPELGFLGADLLPEEPETEFPPLTLVETEKNREEKTVGLTDGQRINVFNPDELASQLMFVFGRKDIDEEEKASSGLVESVLDQILDSNDISDMPEIIKNAFICTEDTSSQDICYSFSEENIPPEIKKILKELVSLYDASETDIPHLTIKKALEGLVSLYDTSETDVPHLKINEALKKIVFLYNKAKNEVYDLREEYTKNPEKFISRPFVKGGDSKYEYLGQGEFGVVHSYFTSSYNDKIKSHNVNVKAEVVKKEQSKNSSDIVMMNEAAFLKPLDHPNIIRLLDSNPRSLTLKHGGTTPFELINRYQSNRLERYMKEKLGVNLNEYILQPEDFDKVTLVLQQETPLTLLECIDRKKELKMWLSSCFIYFFKDSIVIRYFKDKNNNSIANVFAKHLALDMNGTNNEFLHNDENKRKWNSTVFDDRFSPFTFFECICIFYQIAQAIKYLHAQNIEHGNLSMHNIVVDKVGRVRVIDFDAAEYKPKEGIFSVDIQCFKSMLNNIISYNKDDPSFQEHKAFIDEIRKDKDIDSKTIVEKLERFKPYFPEWDYSDTVDLIQDK